MSDGLTLKQIVEAILLASDRPLSLEKIRALLIRDNSSMEAPSLKELRLVLDQLILDYSNRSIELLEVASGWRIQIRQIYAPWVSSLFGERQPRYSKALLEILAIIAYKQPVTRAEIEAIRGVEVNSQITKILFERDWIQIVGRSSNPGHPELLATTRQFLDYFGLRTLDELPQYNDFKNVINVGETMASEDLVATKQARLDFDCNVNEESLDI